MCLNPYLKKMSSQINDCSYIWVNFYVVAIIIVELKNRELYTCWQ